MTYVKKEPQRPGVVDVHNDYILSDVKQGKAHGENTPEVTVSKPRPTWKARTNCRFGRYLFLQCEKKECEIL
jgi:hypothetical protein